MKYRVTGKTITEWEYVIEAGDIFEAEVVAIKRAENCAPPGSYVESNHPEEEQ